MAMLILPPGSYFIQGSALVANSTSLTFSMTCSILVAGSAAPLATTELSMLPAFLDSLGATQNATASASLVGAGNFPDGAMVSLRCRIPAELEADMTLQSGRLIALQVGAVAE
jgi:hypothetical protein